MLEQIFIFRLIIDKCYENEHSKSSRNAHNYQIHIGGTFGLIINEHKIKYMKIQVMYLGNVIIRGKF